MPVFKIFRAGQYKYIELPDHLIPKFVPRNAQLVKDPEEIKHWKDNVPQLITFKISELEKKIPKKLITRLLNCIVQRRGDVITFEIKSDCFRQLQSHLAKDKPRKQERKGRPDINFKNLVAISSALFKGEGISEERKKKRLEICHKCELFVWDEKVKVGRCGICGCKLSSDNSLINLARFEETDKYGCKHPRGSRWKEHGV